MMMSQSHNSRRMLPPGNTRKRKQTEADKPDKQPIPSNKLLAGYLAHEFLTKGTLFGQMFDPTIDRVDSAANSIVGSAVDSTAEQDAELTRPNVRKDHESYGEVASIVKRNGTHIKGIVNPTQLSRWIRM
ncbi:putative embryo sac development arrest 6 [Trifolium medium]|uniref:Putative embryo sac development arrest 6 n=1 Tax=Trifolium medium TaxID=97028 RepID=A0A392MYL5_9FABA|nr:putative embryo sac development arrest 6 [Trifolium medium]